MIKLGLIFATSSSSYGKITKLSSSSTLVKTLQYTGACPVEKVNEF